MKYYVAKKAGRAGDGTKERPFLTIGEAARIAEAGDEVIVGPGIYREYVDPANGGRDEKHRIIYRSREKGGAVISGAEQITDWRHDGGDVWSVRIPNQIFGAYNPYTELIKGDWYFGRDLHTGAVYLNGKELYETFSLETVRKPVVDYGSWEPGFSSYTWYTRQEGAYTVIYANFQGHDPNAETVEINVRRSCFQPSGTGRGYITLSGFVIRQAATQWAPPTAYQEGIVGPHWSKGWIIEDCEISHSRCSGISLGKYLQPDNENKWTTCFSKDGTQTQRDAVCQALREGWTKDTIGSHIVRRCHIHDCGQTGIVGHLGCAFSVIEDNHIHHINHRQDLQGAEIGGIKLHGAIDVFLHRNHIHHCTRGIWLDWQAQGTRVSRNLFHDNVPPTGTVVKNDLALGEDLFVEVSHGPTLIDHNLMLSPCAGRLSTQGLALVHNLIAGSFTYVGAGGENGSVKFASPRYTPYHVPHETGLAGFMTILGGDARFYNNIFVQQPVRPDLAAYIREEGCEDLHRAHFVCGTVPYDGYPGAEEYFGRFSPANCDGWYPDGSNRDVYYDHLPVWMGGNVYCNGARPCGMEADALEVQEQTVKLELEEKDGAFILHTDLYTYLAERRAQPVTTATLGEAFEPEQRFENPDGTAILFDRDYLEREHGMYPLAGPFAEGGSVFIVY